MMQEMRQEFVQAFALSDYAEAPDWYNGSQKWNKLTGSECVSYIASQYNAAWSAWAKAPGTQTAEQVTLWKDRYEMYSGLDDTETSVDRPDWYIGSNAEWNAMSLEDVQNYLNEHRSAVSAARQDTTEWDAALAELNSNVSWRSELQQRDLDRGTDVDNTYALTVTTGTSAGTNVLYFGVVYQSGGQEYTQFILPHEGDLERSIKIASEVDQNSVREKTIVHDIFGYSVKSTDKITALQPYRTDTYLFRPTHTFDSLVRVQVYMAGAKSSTWSCQSLRVYQVDRLYGLASAGYVSDQYFIRFDGTMLARTKQGFDLNANPAMLFTLPADGKGSGAAEYNMEVPTGEDAVVESSKQDYVFRIDMADVWGGSLRALASEVRDNKAALSGLGLSEAMTLSVRYKDTFGAYRDAKIPVVLSALGWAVEQGALSTSDTLAGVAQQGESLAVAATLPDLESVSEVKLSLGTQKALSAVGLVDSVPSTRKSERAAAVNSQNEVYLTGVSMYRAEDVTEQLNAEGTALAPSFSGDPLMCYTSQTSQGNGLNIDTDWTVPMTAYEGQRLTPEELGSQYVIRVTTDDVENAGTISDIKLSLKYRDKAGKDMTTDAFDVHQLVNDYYGYWPGSEGSVDFARAAWTLPTATAQGRAIRWNSRSASRMQTPLPAAPSASARAATTGR